MNISGNTILITGAGTGMGLAAAKAFASLGNRVLMVARNEKRLAEEAAHLPGALHFACDIADPAQVERLVQWAQSNAPELNVLFLNAGVTHTYRLFDGSPARDHAKAEMEVNFVSAVDLTHRFVPLLNGRTAPAIIVTTSGVVYAPDNTNPTYSATKAALHSYIQSMRFTLKKNGSPISLFELVAPLVDSPFSAGVVSDQKASPDEVIREMIDGLAEDRMDIRPVTSETLFDAWRRDPEEAQKMVNDATGA
ncbi:SDR family oxidoreductase [Kushneria aurantia]|uniref:SDR family oxidoreductase n=1 Tax=Kushneria aurantia TaxID=504092 RepID=A0ABV6G2R3_9GAMM|nr:SDR family NAD(P)-dependent oxidoreductase [Kushneria aurantia]